MSKLALSLTLAALLCGCAPAPTYIVMKRTYDGESPAQSRYKVIEVSAAEDGREWRQVSEPNWEPGDQCWIRRKIFGSLFGDPPSYDPIKEDIDCTVWDSSDGPECGERELLPLIRGNKCFY